LAILVELTSSTGISGLWCAGNGVTSKSSGHLI
jgi:hypothetical protein